MSQFQLGSYYSHKLAFPNSQSLVMGPYSLNSKFSPPPWFVDCGIFNPNIQFGVDRLIDEFDMMKFAQDEQFKEIGHPFPDSYSSYTSSDGENWRPFTRLDFEFVEIGQK